MDLNKLLKDIRKYNDEYERLITITDDSSEAEKLRARLILLMTGDNNREDIIQLHEDIEAFFLSDPSEEEKMMVLKYSESLAILYDAVKRGPM